MKSKSNVNFKIFLIALIWIVSILDIFFASRAQFLEANPIFLSIGLKYGLISLGIAKLVFVSIISYWIWNNSYRSERHLFQFSATLIVILLLWGYGAFTGVYGKITYEKQEEIAIEQHIEQKNQQLILERGYPASPQEVEVLEGQKKGEIREVVQQKVEEIAIPYYFRLAWFYGIYPYIFTMLSFFVFRKLYDSATFRKRMLQR